MTQQQGLWPEMDRQQFYSEAQQFLSQVDADWQQHIAQVGECQLQLKPAQEPYEALIRSIAYQQLHGKAAQAILTRFLALYGHSFPSAQQIIDTEDELIRACGFSVRKISSIKAIAAAQQAGIVPSLPNALEMSDQQLIDQLTTLKGVGRWTVEMFLIFNLARQDVWPVDDYAVCQGYKRLKKLEQALGRKQMQLIGEQLKPYRSIAAWYLWRVHD